MRKLLQTLKSWYNNLTHLHIHGIRYKENTDWMKPKKSKPINKSFEELERQSWEFDNHIHLDQEHNIN